MWSVEGFNGRGLIKAGDYNNTEEIFSTAAVVIRTILKDGVEANIKMHKLLLLI